MKSIQIVGRQCKWLCHYCHGKVSPTLPPEHNFAAVVVEHPKGGDTIAHVKCVAKTKAAPTPTPTSFREAAQGVKDTATLRSELAAIEELLVMAGIPIGGSPSDRISIFLSEYLDLKSKSDELAKQVASAKDLTVKEKAELTKAKDELKETQRRLSICQNDRARLEKETEEYEQKLTGLRNAKHKLETLAAALKDVLG